MTVINANDSFTQLAPARVVSTTNLSGTYQNGPTNNGVGATLISTSAAALVIDSVTLVVNDRVLLAGQTSAFQNGLYVVINTGSSAISWILQRAGDFQCIEQMKPGAEVVIAAGTVSAGANFAFVEPVPQAVGVSAISFLSATAAAGLGTAAAKAASDNTSPTLASVEGAPVTTNDLVSFADTAGSIKDSTVAMVGQNMVVSGNIAAGKSGTAGTVSSFPATAATGSLVLAGVSNAGNTTTTISNASMGQASVISIPDPGAPTAKFMLVPQTDALFANAPLVSNAAGVLSFNNSAILNTSVTLTTAQVLAMFATPFQIIAAPGAGLTIMIASLKLYLSHVTTAFAGGGVVVLQYNNTADGAGTNALTGTIPAANVTSAVSTIINAQASVTALTGITNQGIFLSNQTGAFTGGGTSTLTCIVTYQVVTATV